MKVKDTNCMAVLVNKENWLHKDYQAKDLVTVKVNFVSDVLEMSQKMRKEAAGALEKLFSAAKRKKMLLYAVSGYRSYERQRELFKQNKKKDGEAANRYSARAGQSEHQTGLAMDVTCEAVDFELCEDFAGTKEYEWLRENAHRFGFVIRYPREKEEVTGYRFEPWHLRYVGKKIAKELYENELTLEEYGNK
ncbi:MAG: M15 family metallopeptidase [Clostridia bacterium]|nr:M15 family metallopeptidase [Clostridia bacterium]